MSLVVLKLAAAAVAASICISQSRPMRAMLARAAYCLPEPLQLMARDQAIQAEAASRLDIIQA